MITRKQTLELNFELEEEMEKFIEKNKIELSELEYELLDDYINIVSKLKGLNDVKMVKFQKYKDFIIDNTQILSLTTIDIKDELYIFTYLDKEEKDNFYEKENNDENTPYVFYIDIENFLNI